MAGLSHAIGKRIREARLALGLSQESIAQQCSLRAMTISRYENGRCIPGGVALVRLAQALGVTAEQLVCGETEAA